MADHPADVGGGEIGFAGVAAVDVLHRRGQRDRVAAHVTLHALGFAGGAGGIEDVAGFVGFQPQHGDLGVHELLAQTGVIHVASGHVGHLHQTTIHQQHFFRLVAGQVNGFVQQRFVGDALAATRTGVGGHHQLGLGVVDAGGQAVGGKATKHHGVNRADAGAGQHGKAGFCHHRHVNQHAVALGNAQGLHDGRSALDLALQLDEGVNLFLIGFGGDGNQRGFVALADRPAIHGVVAQVGRAADEPLGKRLVGIIQHLTERLLPVDSLGLLGPECLRLFDRLLIKICKTHDASPRCRCDRFARLFEC